MARPKKKNADYFPHDSDMRNDPKVKALRRKFGFVGYSVWSMLLEVLTDSDYFEYEWSELNIELLAGDFDLEPDLLKEIVNYCFTVKLLSIEQDIIYTVKLKERFEGLLNKRKDDRNRKEKEFSDVKTPNNGIKVCENPQSKVKESKVNILSEYSEKQFLEDWAVIRKKLRNLPTNIIRLKPADLINFNQSKKDYSREQLQEAMRGLFGQEVINYTAMITQPTHFLENVEKYYNAFISKDFKQYGSKQVQH